MNRRTLLLSAIAAALAPAIVRPSKAAQQISLTDADRVALEGIEKFLNAITTVQARFVQSSSNGSYAEGEFWVERPYSMRFEYDPPVPLLIIAADQTLALYDKELKQLTQVPVWETPLWFLFDEDIKLADELALTYISHGNGEVVITIQEEQAEGNLSSVTLTFSEAPIALRRWEVIDSQGVLVQTGLINPVYGQPMDPALFDLSALDVYKFDSEN